MTNDCLLCGSTTDRPRLSCSSRSARSPSTFSRLMSFVVYYRSECPRRRATPGYAIPAIRRGLLPRPAPATRPGLVLAPAEYRPPGAHTVWQDAQSSRVPFQRLRSPRHTRIES